MKWAVGVLIGLLGLALALGVSPEAQTAAPATDVWTFGSPADSQTTYSDGTIVPSREWKIFLNGQRAGEVEVHLHKRRGPDGKVDVSFGITAIVYGPPPGGR